MKQVHFRHITRTPERAQLSNFQAKLESTTAIIDRLLLGGRQAPWKASGPTGDGGGTDTGGGGGVDTEL